jgi:CheY-like chemotaxis protein
LVVDDSRTCRLAVLAALAALPGLEPVEADGGLAALGHLARSEIALVVSDVQMPGLGGLELVRFLRGSERHRETPVLLVTGAGEAVRAEGLRLGASACLEKPFDPGRLVELVVRHLGLRSA